MRKLTFVLVFMTFVFGMFIFDVASISTSVCCAASHKVDVNSSSAWFIEEEKKFGADVSIDGGSYQAIAYKMELRSDGAHDVYQMKNNNGKWVYIGVKGVDKHSYSFPSKLSITIFVMVANNAAWTKGYDHMF